MSRDTTGFCVMNLNGGHRSDLGLFDIVEIHVMC